MSETLWRVETVHGEEFSFPVGKREALDQVRTRMESEPLGNPLRVVRIVYRLDPDEPPEPYTGALRQLWRGTVVRFVAVGSLGTYVRKSDSQHCVETDGAGDVANAADWAAPPGSTTPGIISYLGDVADFLRAQGRRFEDSNGRDGLPVSEVIFRDRIATRAQGWTWRPYGGTFHAAHVHSSAFPLRVECL